MRETRSVFGGTDFWKKNEWALGLLSLLTGCFAISIVPFTRKNFGERYLGWLNLYFGYSVVASFMFFGNLLGMLTRSGPSSLMTLFWLAFIVLSLYHRRQIARRNNAGIEWHSMFIGESLLPLPFSQEKIFKIFEPAAVFIAGYFLWKVSGQVGMWLMVSSASLLVNNHIVFYQERQAVLDMRDAQIEAKYMSAAFAGKPAAETAGFVVAESSIKLIGTDARLTDAFDRLSAEMKTLLDAPPDLSGGTAPESTR
jgi:hypothetical protein